MTGKMSGHPIIQVHYTAPGAELKKPPYSGDAGLDVFAVETVTCPPHAISRVDIGMEVALPDGMVCTFITRSSAVVQGLFVIPTLIDNGYRGHLYLFVMNVTDAYMRIDPGVSIAQLMLLANLADGVLIYSVGILPPSERGHNGFGSSGGALGG